MKRGTRDAERRMRWLLLGVLAVLVACGGHTPERDTATIVSSGRSEPSRETGTASREPRPTSRRVVFAGTSLTAGLGLDPDSAYPQLIQRKIDSAGLRYEVVNAGVSGETSAGLLRRLDWLLKDDFSVFVIETGANDGLRGLPVDDTRRNIQAIIDRIKATHPGARVLLVQMEAPPNLGRQYTSAFHAMYPELATANHISLLPFLLQGVAGHAELNQGDGMHPNMRGEHMVADNVWPAVREALGRLNPSSE